MWRGEEGTLGKLNEMTERFSEGRSRNVEVNKLTYIYGRAFAVATSRENKGVLLPTESLPGSRGDNRTIVRRCKFRPEKLK